MSATLTRMIAGQRLEFHAEPCARRDHRVCEIFVKMERTRWVFLGYTRRLPDGTFQALPRVRQGTYVRSAADTPALSQEFRKRSDAIVALWNEYGGGLQLEHRSDHQGHCHMCSCPTSSFTRLEQTRWLPLCSECALTHRPAEILNWRNDPHETHGLVGFLSELHAERGQSATHQRTQHLAP